MSIKKLLRLYAVTPCHAGSGSSLGIVDLPIQREKHTNWPIIQASGVKGAMRMHCNNNGMEEKTINSIFGCSDGKETESTAGSVSITDARILAFPVRSNVAPFIWITCPAVLKRLKKDLQIIGKSIEIDIENILDNNTAKCLTGNVSGKVLVEDMLVEVSGGNATLSSVDLFKDIERLILVSDEIFNYAIDNCTQIMAQIKINEQTGTTATGSLRYIEELPTDTVMYSLINIEDTKNNDELNAEQVFTKIEEKIKQHIQIAGEQTNGRGIFEITWIEGGNNNAN